MNIHIVNGPNLNLLGRREPEIYGRENFNTYLDRLREEFPDCDLSFYQSNHEGELISYIQSVGFDAPYIILNAGGYSHTSVALADAVALVPAKVIEVHISNIYARESFRHTSLITCNCLGSIVGFGLESYALALSACFRLEKGG